MTTATKIWTKDEILHLLNTNNTMIEKSLVNLLERQTPREVASKSTHERNFKGFNGVDAFILTSFAEFYKQNGYLSPKQLTLARKKLVKYAGQLTVIANSNPTRR